MKPADDSKPPRWSKARRREVLASIEATAQRFQSVVITDEEANRLCRELGDLLSSGVTVDQLGPATRLLIALVRRSAGLKGKDDDVKALAEVFAAMAKDRGAGRARNPS